MPRTASSFGLPRDRPNVPTDTRIKFQSKYNAMKDG
jgi:hypothetical protein